jgi:hypothetical protein
MTATGDIALAVEAWATSVVPELNSYPTTPVSIREAMPLVVADIKTDRISSSDLGKYQYQQVAIRLWAVDLLIMVLPVDPWTDSRRLYDMVDALTAALRRDSTMGNRVPIASPQYDANYDPPEVEHADGTVARAATLRVTVGEQLEV